MREGFRKIVGGWKVIDGVDDLAERIELAADWLKCNGPLEPDERATIELMIEARIARGLEEEPLRSFEEYIELRQPRWEDGLCEPEGDLEDDADAEPFWLLDYDRAAPRCSDCGK